MLVSRVTRTPIYRLRVALRGSRPTIWRRVEVQGTMTLPRLHATLQALMGWPTPVYRHHELLAGPDGRRFAKRDGSVTLQALRAGGLTAEALRAELGF